MLNNNRVRGLGRGGGIINSFNITPILENITQITSTITKCVTSPQIASINILKSPASPVSPSKPKHSPIHRNVVKNLFTSNLNVNSSPELEMQKFQKLSG